MSNCSLDTNQYYYEICTGNGVCEGNQCLCDEGWQGKGDFLSMEGTDCHIHVTAVKVLHAICLILVCTNLSMTLSQVIPDTLRAFVPSRAPLGTQKAKISPAGRASKMTTLTDESDGGEKGGDKLNSPKSPKAKKIAPPADFKADPFGKPLGFAVFNDKFYCGKCLNIVSALGYMAFNILHLTTEETVGSDLPVTCANCIGAIFFWACVFTKLYAVVSLSCKSSGLKRDDYNKHLRRYKYSVIVCFLFIFSANCLTFIMLGGQSYQKIGVPLYYILTASCIVGVQINTKIYGGMIIKTMDAVNQGKTEGQMYQQLKKFKLLVTMIVKRSTGTVLINLCFACFPWLHSKAGYQLPFQWAIAQVLLIIVYAKIIPKQLVKLKLVNK
ncbi:hypothetical protein TrST_g7538 [Triparma strigata]|uniref:EGF-like domain-containing protein n=1 Tax=Triparma strigata TaxID=1606541 RepID=A0A9W6ZU58_9STRA|nr:hypothetical protein TrST_g7538 [Triparma strigata]